MAHYFKENLSLTAHDAELLAVVKAIAIEFRPNSIFKPDEEWHQYVVLSLNKFLHDTPPQGSDELRDALALLKADSAEKSAPATVPGSAASSHSDLAMPTDSTAAHAHSRPSKKRSILSQEDGMRSWLVQAATKQPNYQEKTPSFTVHTKGEYTVRVSEGAIPTLEFNLSGPATVQIKTVGPSGAVPSRPELLPPSNHTGLRPCGALPGTFHSMGPNDAKPAPCCASP
ncbi:hypothetical protein QBC32DRAFT_222588 [Pseudoneurospora amorphoporcata]|uniref:Uncharacterized protein n=1 Tax=Pseudoneurospora amorphoporcata TaxID=241081 RepID=A0AAN6NM77_9PEZI|nr:hypothetical protein QBC32DRAFT_222588 [Pseudoneurospora amorphoporcata]